jgi:putative methyltransferase (TIGR04325 family)
MDRPIWEGIYKDIHEVKVIGKGFESATWVNNSKAKVEEYLSNLNENNPIPPIPIRPTSLPLVTAMVKTNEERNLTILDFGGGVGFSYLSLIQNCSKAKNYEYHIIESKEICKAGEEIFSGHPNLFFYPNIQDLSFEKADIIYMNSVLQYIADWKSLLSHLLDLKPKVFLMDDVPAGHIATFATAQNYYESKLPCWFFNVKEIITFFESYDYTLEYKSKFIGTILGKVQNIPMSNFPSHYRLDYPCTLLFNRRFP